MRFLVDESCDHVVVRALRSAGHEVEAISEASPRADDADVLARAAQSGAVVVTEDHDFGRLVFADGRVGAGVILIRFPSSERKALAEAILQVVAGQDERLRGRFVVVEPGRVRISPPLGPAGA